MEIVLDPMFSRLIVDGDRVLLKTRVNVAPAPRPPRGPGRGGCALPSERIAYSHTPLGAAVVAAVGRSGQPV